MRSRTTLNSCVKLPMKSVYKASTSLDAHMILNLLLHEGIEGRIDGEYLPGGVGELQAMNLVRVMVDEADYERAVQVIETWEAIEVDEEEKSGNKSSAGVSVFLVGVIIGGGLMYWVYNTPVTEGGIDLNGDGVLDEKWIYRDDRISRTEVDRNFDGNADVIYSFDRKGVLKDSKQDDDFDGVFESVFRYEDGVTDTQESDLNQDGNIDLKAKYMYGNLDELIILGEGQDLRKKRQKFKMGKLVSADYDADGDGNYDISYEYDYFEEVRTKSDKRPRIDVNSSRY
jgi:hypothetical protein